MSSTIMALLNQKTKLIDFSFAYQQRKDFLREHPRFSIMFTPGFLGIDKRKICRTILDPLIPATQNILIYELQTKNKKVQKYNSHLKKHHGRRVLDMAGKRWEYFIPLLYKPRILSTIHEIRGSILIHCLYQDVPWENIFEHCYGPFTVSNPSVGCGKAALNYAKQKFDAHNVFLIIEKINSGLESITISCHNNILNSIFDIAAKTCNLTTMIESEYELIEKGRKDIDLYESLQKHKGV